MGFSATQGVEQCFLHLQARGVEAEVLLYIINYSPLGPTCRSKNGRCQNKAGKDIIKVKLGNA